MYTSCRQGQFSSCAVNTALMSPATGVRRVPGRAGQRRAGRDETTNRRRARDDRLASDTQGAARMIDRLAGGVRCGGVGGCAGCPAAGRHGQRHSSDGYDPRLLSVRCCPWRVSLSGDREWRMKSASELWLQSAPTRCCPW